MKIKYINQKFDGSIHPKITSVDWCCDKIDDNPAIVLKEDVDNNPNITLAYYYVLDWEHWVEDAEYFTIKYCPFCGEPVETECMGEEDLTEEYESLKTQLDKLQRKYERTDSLKMRGKINKELRVLSKEMEEFYTLWVDREDEKGE